MDTTAAQHLLIINVNAFAGREDEFNRWYDEYHLREVVTYNTNLAAGRRYRLSELQRLDAQPWPWKYLTLYDVEGDIDEALTTGRRVMDRNAYTPHNGALDQEGHAGYYYTPLGEPYRLPGWPGRSSASHLMMVRSNPGAQGEDAYNAWYDTHVREVVNNIDGYMGARRYKLSIHQRPESPPSPWQYRTIFEIQTADLRAVQRAHSDAVTAGRLTPNNGAVADDYNSQDLVAIGNEFEYHTPREEAVSSSH